MTEPWLSGTRRCAIAAAAIAAAFLFLGIGRDGLIDPDELDRAELARRLAVHLFGAGELSREGDPATIPTLGDLGAGELGFTSMAWGFATFGLSPGAGRFPLALWAFGGALALFALVARLGRPRAALYAVAVLVTMPAYFVQARMMLGDAVALAAFAIALAGLTLAVFDEAPRVRAVALLFGIAGVGAGFLARGALLGVAAPLSTVGLAWLAMTLQGHARRQGRRVGAAALVGGVVAAVVALVSLGGHGWSDPTVSRMAGVSLLTAPPVEATFDLTLRDLGHALFPWSAFLPLAIAAVVARGVRARPRGEMGLRLAVCFGAIAAFAAHAWLGVYAGALPFVGLSALAAIAGLALDDLDRSEWPPATAVVAMVLAGLLYRDFSLAPEKSLVALGIDTAVELPALPHLPRAAAVFVIVLAAGLLGAPGSGQILRWLRDRKQAYAASARALGGLWRGNLVFGFLLLEASLVGVAAMFVVGRSLAWPTVLAISLPWARLGLNAWWLLPLGLLALPLGLDALRLGHALTAALLRLPRSGPLVLGGLVAGAILCFGHYPALAARLSPRAAFERYQASRGPGEPLALLGLRSRGAHYYAGGDRVMGFADPKEAHRWLVGGTERRWLVFRVDELPALNASHRAVTGDNLPVAAAEPPIFLASNRSTTPDENPLAPFVLKAPPPVQHPLDIEIGGALRVMGWSLLDERGAPVEAIALGRRHRLELVFQVLRPIGRDYEIFVHLDGEGRRHNGDHPAIGGLYPTSRWRAGDVIVDPYDLRLSPSPGPGRYRLYFGLFRGEERLPVTDGPRSSDRVSAGTLLVE
jgi:hypothetical protein